MQKGTILSVVCLPLLLAAFIIMPIPAKAGIGQEVKNIQTEDFSARRKHRHYNRHYSKRKSRFVSDANGNKVTGIVISHKTGAKASVSPTYAPKFQAYIDDIETNYGARVRFMGGYRRGPCHSGSLHPCGRALDVCQLSRGLVDSSCHLPGRVVLAAVALKHGLFEGGMWCSSDYGHVQAGVSSGACDRNIYAAVKKFKLVNLAAITPDEDPEAKVYYLGDAPVADVDKKVAVDMVRVARENTGRTLHARVKRVHTARVRATRVYQQATYGWQPQQYQQQYSYQYQAQPQQRVRYRYQARRHYQRISVVETITLSAMAKKPETYIASNYNEPQRLAGGGWLNPKAMAVAHKTLPLGTRLTMYHGRKQAVVVVNDRGPYIRGRTFDLTLAAKKALGCGSLCRVRVEPWPPLPKPSPLPKVVEDAIAWGKE